MLNLYPCERTTTHTLKPCWVPRTHALRKDTCTRMYVCACHYKCKFKRPNANAPMHETHRSGGAMTTAFLGVMNDNAGSFFTDAGVFAWDFMSLVLCVSLYLSLSLFLFLSFFLSLSLYLSLSLSLCLSLTLSLSLPLFLFFPLSVSHTHTFVVLCHLEQL